MSARDPASFFCHPFFRRKKTSPSLLWRLTHLVVRICCHQQACPSLDFAYELDVPSVQSAHLAPQPQHVLPNCPDSLVSSKLTISLGIKRDRSKRLAFAAASHKAVLVPRYNATKPAMPGEYHLKPILLRTCPLRICAPGQFLLNLNR